MSISRIIIFTFLILGISITLSCSSKEEQYAWDAFYDQNGNTQWRCRDKYTKRFAKSSLCEGQLKEDKTWPKK